LSLYRVHFKWKNREIFLTAKSLDLTHPYFVSIKDLVFSTEKRLIINPADEDIRNAFGAAQHLMIPFQAVSLIEEFSEQSQSRVMPFSIVGGEEETGGASPEETS
jgi:hypothetical protein